MQAQIYLAAHSGHKQCIVGRVNRACDPVFAHSGHRTRTPLYPFK